MDKIDNLVTFSSGFNQTRGVSTKPEAFNMYRCCEAWGWPMHKACIISEIIFFPFSSNWKIFNQVSSPSDLKAERTVSKML